jgi:hypothetical protein
MAEDHQKGSYSNQRSGFWVSFSQLLENQPVTYHFLKLNQILIFLFGDSYISNRRPLLSDNTG